MKLALLGAGNIARKMANTVNEMEGVELYAVAARDLDRAQAFAAEYKVEKAFGSYEEMVQDPGVELVYICTLNHVHLDHVKLCLNHGKHVLCEKPFMINAHQAREAVALAREKNLLLAEAIWTRYLPMRKTLDDLLANDAIGEISTLTASLGYTRHYVERMHKPEVGGGAMLDLGIYVLNFACMVLGSQVARVEAMSVFNDRGVDVRDNIALVFESEKMASLCITFLATMDRAGHIHGRDGYIKVTNINNPEAIEIYDTAYQLVKRIEAPKQITGFEYQVLACKRAIEAGQVECEEMPHAEMIRMMEIMDQARAKCGIVFECDK